MSNQDSPKRCDGCKQWGRSGYPGLGTCARLSESYYTGLMKACAVADDDYGLQFVCPPEFFCAYWEER